MKSGKCRRLIPKSERLKNICRKPRKRKFLFFRVNKIENEIFQFGNGLVQTETGSRRGGGAFRSCRYPTWNFDWNLEMKENGWNYFFCNQQPKHFNLQRDLGNPRKRFWRRRRRITIRNRTRKMKILIEQFDPDFFEPVITCRGKHWKVRLRFYKRI